MKRKNNLYEQICSIENLQLAAATAQHGKGKQYGVKLFNQNEEANIQALHEMLVNKTYRTSPYSVIIVREPKERIVYRLPFFPDRIIHHAAINILKPYFLACFTADTYSSIEGRGQHKAANAVNTALKDRDNTTYCLKLDIKKFYPSINNEILKQLLRRKFKDNDLLWLLDEIIESIAGVPIGNYTSQFFANFYLTYFDHWLKENMRVKYYFRYCDDMVILHASKKYLHNLRIEIEKYLHDNLKLKVKDNWQIFPVSDKNGRGVDFVGYVFYHGYTLLRKSIKQNFARAIAKKKGLQTINSYKGWAKHCNAKHLMYKILGRYE